MLVGELEVKANGKVYRYSVTGVDTVNVCSLNLVGRDNDAYEYMAYTPDAIGVPLSSRRVDIKMSKVVVETTTTLNEKTGKQMKTPVNGDLFCRLGALIRYIKTHCYTKYVENYTGLALASGDFDSNTRLKYFIPYETKDERLATVVLNIGSITYIDFETPDFKMTMCDDTDIDQELFISIKNGSQLGLRFNEEYLGIPLKEEEQKEDNTNVVLSKGMYTCIEDIIKAHPDKEFKWLLGKDYRIVDDEHLEEICDYIMNWDGYVYYDTETTGLQINFLSRVGQADQLVGVVLSVKYGESFYFPLQMKHIPNLCGGDHKYVMEHYMKPILEKKELVAHNMAYDWKVAYIYDINANIVHDTMALIKLTIGAEKDIPMGLKDNAKMFLHRDSLELSDLLVDNSWGETDDIKFWDLPYELVRLYACADTDNTNGLLQYALQNDLLGKYGANKVYDIEIAFSYAVSYQEFYGHRIDVQHLGTLRAEIQQEQDKYMAKMVDLVGHEFNPNSSPQLQSIMYNELGIPVQISRKTNRPTTDKATLKMLAETTDENDEAKYPFCVYMQKYREAEGVRKIVDKFPEHVTSDGFVFSHVMQYGTTTGRVSINTPNYQSYNDPVKKNVVPRPGYWMFDTDYSSVEYRVLGNMVGNKKIMESFKDPDFDYHQYQAARMYGVPYAAVDKKKRKSAKGINFGLPYGMGDESLGATIFGDISPENTKAAAKLREAYFKGQEDIRDWFEDKRRMGVELGYTQTYFGRRRYYDKAQFSVAKIRRQAGNQVIQGSAADIYKTAVGRVFKRICKEGWLGKVLFTGFIHDELLGEVSNDINPGVFLKVLREEFEVKVTNDDGTPWCPLYMGFGYGMSWYEAKSVELPIKLQWEIVERYGETGFPTWTGDGRAFCDTVPDMLRDFAVRDIRAQITDANNQGKEIKPALNKDLISCVKEDSSLYEKGLKEYFETYHLTSVDKDFLAKYQPHMEYVLDGKYHIQSLLLDENGDLITSFKPSDKTQDCLDMFCKLHKTDRSQVNLLDIPDVVVTEESGTSSGGLALDIVNKDAEELLENQIMLKGFHTDVEEKIFYIELTNPLLLREILMNCNTDGKGYNIWVFYPETKVKQATLQYVDYTEVKAVIDKITQMKIIQNQRG